MDINSANYQRYLSALKKMSFERFTNIVKSRFVNIPHTLTWYLPWGFSKINKQRLFAYKNIHKGKRCFIIANGPSLNKIDLSLLKDEFTIGMNRIYLLKKTKKFSPTYLVSVDGTCQLEQFPEDYNKVDVPCFYNWNQRKIFSKKNNQHFVKVRFGIEFSRDIIKEKTGNGASVTYTCMQLAFYMGFKEVYLIGKDHSYDTSLRSGKRVVSDGKEENHFIKGYYKPGMVWGSPSYDIEEMAYTLAKKTFEKEGRVIKDATINGKLDVFDKVGFYSLF